MISNQQTYRGLLRSIVVMVGIGFLAGGDLGSLAAETSETGSTPLFDVKIKVEGTANWIPRSDGSSALVLFPDSDKVSKDLQVRSALHGDPLCHHHAFVQFDSRHLGLPVSEWISIDVSGNWLKFDAPEADPFAAGDLPLPGLPPLDAVLASVGKTFVPWNGSTEFMRAGLLVDRGVVGAVEENLREYVFSMSETPVTGFYSNLHEITLGPVSSLSLRLREFGAQEDRILPFAAPPSSGGEPGAVEIWVRHMCTLDEPGSGPSPEMELSFDPDFPLAYAFQSKSVLADAARLPFPRTPDSGGSTMRCMAAQTPALAFSDPFGQTN